MPDPRIPTLRDVALRARVHVATASRALNARQEHLVTEATRERVREAADALGYRANTIAQSLRRGVTGALGVIVPDLGNPFMVSLLRGIERESSRREVLPLVAETHDDPAVLRSVVTRLLGNRIDGLVLGAAHTSDGALITEIERVVPVVLAVRTIAPDSSSGAATHLEVLPDDVSGARTAVEHLVALGHRRIAEVPGPGMISSFINRTAGYRSAIGSTPEVRDVSTGDRAEASTVAEGRRVTAELLRRDPGLWPTAIFAHNDLMAVGALDALRAAGLRCPEDVSIVGYNDAPLSDHLDPALTTVRLPGIALGEHSARMLLGAIAGEPAGTRRIVLMPEFIQRHSTRPPPDARRS